MFTCLNCNKEQPKKKNCANKYCNNKCQKEYENKLNIQDWIEGKDCGWTGKTRQLKAFVRRYLFDVRGTACEECGWDKRHPDGSILTEIDHIDGDAENCTSSNLRILCPNCHAMTPTFRSRNPVSKRSRS